jgi:hypothetical protein
MSVFTRRTAIRHEEQQGMRDMSEGRIATDPAVAHAAAPSAMARPAAGGAEAGHRPAARREAYDLSGAQLDPAVPLEDHRQALAVVQGWFRSAGLSADEARMLVDRFNAAVDPYTRPTAAGDALAEEARDYLRARWGADFARNMALAEAAIGRLGGAPLVRFLEASGLRFDPFVLRTLVDVAVRSGWS